MSFHSAESRAIARKMVLPKGEFTASHFKGITSNTHAVGQILSQYANQGLVERVKKETNANVWIWRAKE